LRTVDLNGYIDEDEFWGDEITPNKLNDILYGDKDQEVTLRINSYGGSCIAAVRMADMIQAYPGVVNTHVTGIAASAAVALVLSGKRVSMTAGSLMMIHNPSCVAYGEVVDFVKAIGMLKSAKESILNMYETRSKRSRNALSDMMDAETWMDSKAALDNGFVDEIAGEDKTVKNTGRPAVVDRDEAEKLVAAWGERRLRKPKGVPEDDEHGTPEKEPRNGAQQAGTPADQCYKRLNLIKE
jgi:ATP-dependent protease ClpP protease subunit